MAYGRRPRFFGEFIGTGRSRQAGATTGREQRGETFRFGRIGALHRGFSPETDEMDYGIAPEAPPSMVAPEPAEEMGNRADFQGPTGQSLAEKMSGLRDEMGYGEDPEASMSFTEQGKVALGSLLGSMGRTSRRQSMLGYTAQGLYGSKPQTAMKMASVAKSLGPLSVPFAGLGISLDMQRGKAQKAYDAALAHSPELAKAYEAKYGPELARLGVTTVDWENLPPDSPLKERVREAPPAYEPYAATPETKAGFVDDPGLLGRDTRTPAFDFSHRRDPFDYEGPSRQRQAVNLGRDIEPYGGARDRALGETASPQTIASFDELSRETGPGVAPEGGITVGRTDSPGAPDTSEAGRSAPSTDIGSGSGADTGTGPGGRGDTSTGSTDIDTSETGESEGPGASCVVLGYMYPNDRKVERYSAVFCGRHMSYQHLDGYYTVGLWWIDKWNHYPQTKAWGERWIVRPFWHYILHRLDRRKGSLFDRLAGSFWMALYKRLGRKGVVPQELFHQGCIGTKIGE